MIDRPVFVVRHDISGGGDGTRWGDAAMFSDVEDAIEVAMSGAPYYGYVVRRVVRVYESVAGYLSLPPAERCGPADVQVWDYWSTREDRGVGS